MGGSPDSAAACSTAGSRSTSPTELRNSSGRSKPEFDGTLVKALARAWRWQRLLDAGVYTSVTEIAEAEGIGKSYISRILRLALLAPDLVEGIVEGRANQALMLERLERPLPADWAQQRQGLRAGAAERCEGISPAASEP